jgi:hypothetical protein
LSDEGEPLGVHLTARHPCLADVLADDVGHRGRPAEEDVALGDVGHELEQMRGPEQVAPRAGVVADE